MPKRDAQAIWYDPKYSVEEKIELMRGWSKFTAYKEFGGTGIVSGRRPRQ